MRKQRVVIIGAGIGGLVAALELASRGSEVTLIEQADAPGGKMREAMVGGARIDAGPTVFTMRWVFEELFAACGLVLADHLTLRPAAILARHAWSASERLDLFADLNRSADAIAAFAGPGEARGFLEFSARARHIYRTVERDFIRGARPTPLSLAAGAGLRGLPDLWRIAPFATLWQALGEHFSDRRLRQLFGRYATYCGASPFLAPATLMLVAHVEQDGVWLVEGGMHRIASVLARLIVARGAGLRYNAAAREILLAGGRVAGVRLASGERLDAEAVVLNADVAALAAGRFGAAAAAGAPPTDAASRSLSALTWAMQARCSGFPLARHTVFFSADYAAEFDAIFRRRALPERPTVYVCAQDRDDAGGWTGSGQGDGPERLLCLVNAPATGDIGRLDATEIERCETATFDLLVRCGLSLQRRPELTRRTTPEMFERLFPATGGALYGRASHGWRASFSRPGSRCRVPGLYLAGGSTHPGPGVPMAALSGRQAAASLLADLASTSRSRPTGTAGGTRTR